MIYFIRKEKLNTEIVDFAFQNDIKLKKNIIKCITKTITKFGSLHFKIV